VADIWNQVPGAAKSTSRAMTVLKKLIGSFLVGALSVGMAWAGASLVPAADETIDSGAVLGGRKDVLPNNTGITAGDGAGATAGETSTLNLDLGTGRLMAGAAKVSLEPRPQDYNGTWETNYDKCATLSDSPGGVQEGATHVADFRVRWAENPNCIYMGGYGIGPMNPIVDWDDEYGLWTRSVAMSDGQDTFVLTLIDAVYWEAQYNNMCSGCGFTDLAQELAAETGLKPESFIQAIDAERVAITQTSRSRSR
jgi:hypothetical protein